MSAWIKARNFQTIEIWPCKPCLMLSIKPTNGRRTYHFFFAKNLMITAPWLIHSLWLPKSDMKNSYFSRTSTSHPMNRLECNWKRTYRQRFKRMATVCAAMVLETMAQSWHSIVLGTELNLNHQKVLQKTRHPFVNPVFIQISKGNPSFEKNTLKKKLTPENIGLW